MQGFSLDVESSVRHRYSEACREPEQKLCCPIRTDPKFLDAIPDEVLQRDYGCGDPTRYVREGETVLDLGSGAGKACFVAAQAVGPTGRVIGVDMNEEMLELSRRNAPEVARRIGYANVEFRRGRIQELGPIVADGSVDLVLSNCVLNLVRNEDKRELFREIHRVLRRGGRAVISDITSDRAVPEPLQRDPELWSGCISGAMREDEFLLAFEEAGFDGVSLLERAADPWQVVDGIEFRSLTVAAYKGKEGPCIHQGRWAIYKGPFRQIEDDDGHVFRRGVRTTVCEKTAAILMNGPYAGLFDVVGGPGDLRERGTGACGPSSGCC